MSPEAIHDMTVECYYEITYDVSSNCAILDDLK